MKKDKIEKLRVKGNLFGFTLIELLVVITIIGILAAFAIFGVRNAFQNARNTQRQSDIKQFQNALETYANRNSGLYPDRINSSADASSSTGLCLTLGLSGCPHDPNYVVGLGPYYLYRTNDGNAGNGDFQAEATTFALWVQLEPSSANKNWIVCSSGKTGESTSEPSGANLCPLP